MLGRFNPTQSFCAVCFEIRAHHFAAVSREQSRQRLPPYTEPETAGARAEKSSLPQTLANEHKLPKLAMITQSRADLPRPKAKPRLLEILLSATSGLVDNAKRRSPWKGISGIVPWRNCRRIGEMDQPALLAMKSEFMLQCIEPMTCP